MPEPEPMIRNISDTARWVAVYRAKEMERPDALFRDPLARKLAGERGELIAQKLAFARDSSWPFIVRTVLFDQIIMQEVQRGTDMVINLAAGLDARPYRMDVPTSLQWIEVDLPELIEEKQHTLANERPRCRVERVAVDLANVQARGELFDQLGRRTKRALILSEGLLIYLSPEDVGELAKDLAGQKAFERWAIDLASPGMLQIMEKRWSGPLRDAGAPFKFAPEKGAEFFEDFGWNAIEVHSFLKAAKRLKRLPTYLRVLTTLIRQTDRPRNPKQPWGGICLLERR